MYNCDNLKPNKKFSFKNYMKIIDKCYIIKLNINNVI